MLQLFYVKTMSPRHTPIPVWHWTWGVIRLYGGRGFSVGASCLVLTAPHFRSKGHCSPCSPKILCRSLILRVLSTHLGFEKSQLESSKLCIGRFYVTQAPGTDYLYSCCSSKANTEPSFRLCFFWQHVGGCSQTAFKSYFKDDSTKMFQGSSLGVWWQKNPCVVWLTASFPSLSRCVLAP